jgi:hypothetical protein
VSGHWPRADRVCINSLLDKALGNVLWEDLLLKLEAKLSSWTFLSLNLPDRITLIKFVLHYMPLYLFYVLVYPLKIIKSIHSLQRVFLWGGETKERKWDLVAWEKFCGPKATRGLGFKDP